MGGLASNVDRIVLALLGAVALATPIGASAAVEPGGGSTFDSSAGGWTSEVATCQAPPPAAPEEECTATNAHDAGVGNPPGSLRSRLTLDTGLLLFDSDYMWRSPSFRIPGDPGAEVRGAEFGYDRQFSAGELINVNPEAEVEAAVVDETAGTRTVLVEEDLDSDDDEFERATATAETGTVTREHIHHIELQAAINTTSMAGGVSGSSSLYFDNVAIDVPGPPGNSPGVTFPRPPKDGAAITALMRSLNLDALAGGGPDGSQVPLDQCTIVGTSGADRMRGTTANDVLCGLGGNDSISGRRGRDVIDTAAGNDKAIGNKGGDFILGLSGNDVVRARKGKDSIGGGGGGDQLRGQGNADLLSARDGTKDLVHGGASHRDRARADRVDRVRKVEHR